jgi:decaprenylphosphoryl-5-phosphoribose phosphatase
MSSSDAAVPAAGVAARTDARARARRDARARADACAAEPPGPVPTADPLSSAPHPVREAIRTADRRVLYAFRRYGDAPGVAAWARGLGWAGEHAGVWLAAGTCAALLDTGRRDSWARASVLVAGAHAASMVLKRCIRRPRPYSRPVPHLYLYPHFPPRPDASPPAATPPLVRTAGAHSFPSSHAASSAAAAVAFTALAPGAPVRPLAAAVCLSRLVTGVHYPSDVAFGVLLGAAAARLGRPWVLGARRAGGSHG